jgi:GntR family transcriptional repressor for pyruvate dehydrogenase complex
MTQMRTVPTARARAIFERVIELNRMSGEPEPELEHEADDEAGTSLALTPVRRRRLYEDVVFQLQGLISSGRLEPGDQLPSERALSDQLAVSRTSVREALRILEARGMLEARPGQGLFVRGRRTEEIVSVLASYLVRERESFLEVLDVREALERKAAERAAILATTKNLEELKAAVVAMQDEVLEGHPPLESDTEFHRAIARASRNEVLRQTLDTVLGLMAGRRQEILTERHGALLMLHQHVNIYRAIRNRDAKLAGELVSSHLRDLGRVEHRWGRVYPDDE